MPRHTRRRFDCWQWSASSGQYEGVAPAATILNLRVLDDTGMGQDSYVISAIQAAIKMKTSYNLRVINLSLGRPVYESYTLDPLCQAVEQAWKAGFVVVVAAGNDGRNDSAGTNGYGTITAPGNDPYVITVSAPQLGQTCQSNAPSRAITRIRQLPSDGFLPPLVRRHPALLQPKCCRSLWPRNLHEHLDWNAWKVQFLWRWLESVKN